MRRGAPALIVFALLSLAVPASARQEEEPNPVDQFIQAVNAPENQKWVSQFLRQPVPGKGTVMDPTGDFEHSTGNSPGYTPDHIDIVDTWALDFDPGDIPLFGPTDAGEGLWQVGPGHVDLGAGMPLHTFTSDAGPQDGSQFADGAYLFGFTTVGMPPAMVPGRCEFVVWSWDMTRSSRWENRPEFPRDPAGGTNMAWGIGLNPESQGLSGTFTLDLGSSGFFEPRPEYDIRGFILDDYVGLFVPKSTVPDISALNYYAFCVDEGFSFDAAHTGSDQTGLIDLTPADFGSVTIALQSTTTTTSSTTTTTTAPTTTTAVAETTTTLAATAAEDGGFPWGLVLGGGLVLALIGYWLFREKGDPCADELAAWKAAQADCERAQALAAESQEKCEDATADREDLEEERKEVCREWPPACWSSEDGSWVEDEAGNRITSRDLHMRRMALGQVWDDYKAGKLSAQEVEAQWRQADTPEFRESMRARDAAAKADLESIDAEIVTARKAEKAACDTAREAREAADAACDTADAARRRYEECIGAASAAATPTSEGDGGSGGGPGSGPAGPSGPGIATGGGDQQPRRDPCEGQPSRKVEPGGRAESIVVSVDFTMIIEAWEGSERNTEAGEQLVIDLNRVAQELDVAGDLLSAREAGLHVAGGVNGYSAGKYVAGTSGIVKGGIGAVQAGTDLMPDVPTSIPTAITETLESVARLGGFIAGKVTDWMRNYQIMEARVTYFTQRITATPYLVYECRKGQGWVCVEKVWEYDIGNLRRRTGQRSRSHLGTSNLDRARMQRDFQRLGRVATNTITRDAKRLAEWRSTHEPGPCPGAGGGQGSH